MPVFGLLLIGITVLGMFIWYRSRSAGSRIKRLEAEITRLSRRRCQQERKDHCLARIMALLQSSIASCRTAEAYQAVELLKTAYGAGFARTGELSHLVGLSVMALRESQCDLAGALMDAARVAVRRQTDGQILETLQQLELLAIVALKEKQNFIAAKATELIITVAEKVEPAVQQTEVHRVIASFKVIGGLVIRRRDPYLLREITGCLNDWFSRVPSYADEPMAELIAAWFHRTLHSSELSSFDIVEEHLTNLLVVRGLSDLATRRLISEMKNMAGTICLDPSDKRGAKCVRLILELSVLQQNAEMAVVSVQAVGEVVRMVIHNQDLAFAFPSLVPLLDLGRRMLALEMKFGGTATVGGYRERVLFFIIRESLSVFAFEARKRMTATVADTLDESIVLWQQGEETQHTIKSYQKFCALLRLYHAANRRQKAASAEWKSEYLSLFKGREQERLNVFIGGLQHELFSRAGSEI